MINTFIGFLFLALLSTFWSLFFGIVTELPFGLDEPVDFFMSIINNLRNLMPWLDTLWNVFIIALIVKIAIWSMDKIMWLIGIIRGGG